MAKFLRLSDGVPRSFEEGAGVAIYDQPLTIVAAGAGANQMNGPVTAGTSITLPGGQTYTANELEIRVNGLRIEALYDYSYVGSAPRTQVQLTFQLEVGDRLDFRIDRAA